MLSLSPSHFRSFALSPARNFARSLPPHSLPVFPRLLQRRGGVVGGVVVVVFYEIAVALFEQVEGFDHGVGGDLVVPFDQGVEGVFFGDGVFFLDDDIAGVQAFFHEVDADAGFLLAFVEHPKRGEPAAVFELDNFSYKLKNPGIRGLIIILNWKTCWL